MSINTNPLVTIIILYYNIEHSLFERCISSALNQYYDNFEILVVDDGSKAENADYLDEKYGTNPRVRILHKINGGISSARNFGMDHAGGEWICFLDSDDYISPDFLSNSIFANHLDSELDIITSYILPSYDEIYKFDKRKLQKSDYHIFSNPEDIDYATELVLVGTNKKPEPIGYISCGPNALIVRKSLAEKFKFPLDYISMEDVFWNFKTFREAKKYCIVDFTSYIYYQNPSSATHRVDLI